MIRSLFAGVSGIRTHQVRLDVIGSNIANVNTTGFKKGRASFQGLLSQVVSGAAAPTSERGGLNPIQIGLGVQLGAITNDFGQGSLGFTGRNSDLSIEGNGFFVVGDGVAQRFTRAGNFTLDRDGSLVDAISGLNVQGWLADTDGTINSNVALKDVSIPSATTVPANPTTSAKYAQNLDQRTFATLLYGPSPITVTDGTSSEQAQVSIALEKTGDFNKWSWTATVIPLNGATATTTGGTGTVTLDKDGAVTAVTGGPINIAFGSGESVVVGAPSVSGTNGGSFAVTSSGDTQTGTLGGVFTAAPTVVGSIDIYDPLGGAHTLDMTMTKSSDNIWLWSASSPDNDITVTGSGQLNFNGTTGKLLTASATPVTVAFGGGMGSKSIALDFTQVTQFAADGTFNAQSQNGFGSGSLESFSIDATGTVSGIFSNGVIQKIAQIAMASFSNPAGLSKEGNNSFVATINSGEPNLGSASSGGRGRIHSGFLEGSNVELSEEFTDLITTQRGFQANARMITASDEVFQELINVRR